MRLIQRNWKNSFYMALAFTAFGGIVGLVYHYRGGYELITPAPLPAHSIKPEARKGVEPKVCVAFNPLENSFAYSNGNCPKNYAYFGNHKIGGKNKEGPGELVEMRGLCCPLPANDILTDRHTYNEFEECPDQYIATGGAGVCGVNCSMRCTQINSNKYKLGEEKMSYYVQFAKAGRLHGQGRAKRIFWEQLPVSIRYGVSREDHKQWRANSCIGVPLGSLLVKKLSKRCEGFFYRELQYLDGTPVKMLPDCEYISDPYAKEPKCLGPGQGSEAVQAVIIPDKKGLSYD